MTSRVAVPFLSPFAPPILGALVFGAVLCGMAFLEALAVRPHLPLPLDAGGILLGGAGLLVPVATATAFASLVERRSVRSYGLGARNWRQMLARGAAAGIVTFFGVVSVLATTQHYNIGGWWTLGFDELALGVLWFLFYALLSVAEELLFRGYLLASITRLMGFGRAAVLTGIAFAIVHFMSPYATAVVLLSLTVAGIALAWIVRLTGSIWWGVGFLTAWNWSQHFAYAAAPARLLTNAADRSYPVGDQAISGGPYGVEASIVVLPVAVLALAIAIVMVKRSEGAASRSARRY